MRVSFYRLVTGIGIAGLIAGCDPSNVRSKSWVEEHRSEAQECLAAIERDGIHNGRDLEDVRRTFDSSTHQGWEDRMRFEIYLSECKDRTMFTGYKKREDPAELREKALAEADNAIRDDIENRRARLNKASRHHEIKVLGHNRFDTYDMKDGRVIICRTKVNDIGPLMDCDGDV